MVAGVWFTSYINYKIAHFFSGNPCLAENQAWIIETGWRWNMSARVSAPAASFRPDAFLHSGKPALVD